MSQVHSAVIADPARLEALRRLVLLDTPAEPAFDRLTRLAARLLKAPVVLLSLIDEDRQFFKSSIGLPEPWASAREIPLAFSFCQHAVASGAPLIITDARLPPLVSDNPAIAVFGMVAYAGIPLVLASGHAIGVFGAMDVVPRKWTDDQIATLHDLAEVTMAQIALRSDVAACTTELQAANERVQAEQTERWLAEERQRLLIEQLPAIVWTTDREMRFTSSIGPRVGGQHRQPNPIVGTACSDFLETNDPASPPITAQSRALAGEAVTYELERQGRRFQTHVEPFRDAQAQIIGTIGLMVDITEHKQVGMMQRVSEERYRTLFAAAARQAQELALLDRIRTALARELDLSTVLRTVVDSIAATFGYTQVSLYVREGEELVLQHQVGYQRVIARIPLTAGVSGRVARTGQPMLLEDVRTDPAFLGAIAGIASEICVPLRDQDRVVGILNVESTQGVILTHADLRLMIALSEQVNIAIGRARLYTELQENERRIATLLSNMPGMAYRSRNDRNWTNEFVSEGAFELTGYRPVDLIGSQTISFAQLIHSDDRKRIWKDVQAAVQARQPFRCVYRITSAGGEEKWVWEQGRGVFAPNGALLALEGFITDITERVQAEQALQQSEERFAKAFHASPVSITITSLASGRFVDVNDSFLDLMGFTREQVVGHTSIELGVWANPNDRDRVARTLREARSIRSLEIPFRARSGAIIETLASLELVDLNGERCVLCLTHDITERKRIEAALREREAMIRAIGDNLPDGMIYQVTRTPEGATRFTYASAGLEKLWGITVEQLRANPRSIQEKYYEADLVNFWAVADKSWRTLTPFDIEIRRHAPDGTLRWSHLRSQPHRFDDGRVVWNGVEIDITAYKEAEQALRESERQLREMLENIQAIAVTLDAQGTVIFCNDFVLNLTGWQRAEVIGRDWFDVFLRPDGRAVLRPIFLESVRTGSNMIAHFESDIITRAGERRLVAWTNTLLRDLQGNTIGVTSIGEDITERRRSEQALRESEKHFRQLSEVSFEGIAIHDQGIILDANTAQARLLGYEPGEIIGMNVMQFATPESRSIIRNNIRAGFEGPYEVIGLRKDGTTLPIEVQAKVLTYQGRRVRVAAIRDITERKRAEAERERLISELTEALASIKTLRGLLPICSSCKKIRDDRGYWNQIESYIKSHTEANFTHGICPDCAGRLYGDLLDDDSPHFG